MSIFGQGTAAPGSGSLFGGLNLSTNSNPDPFKKRASIFETTPSSQQPTEASSKPSPFASLFANNPTTSAPSSGGLFGGTATTKAGEGLGFSLGLGNTPTSAPSTSAPFASWGAGTTTSAPPTGGLFGDVRAPLTTSAPPTGGLFGNLGSSTTTAAPSGGLFGSLGATTSTAAPSGGHFGTTTTDNRQAGGGFSLGRLDGQQRPSNLTATTTQNNPQDPTQSIQGQAQARDPAHFNSLLERQKKRARLQNEQRNGRLAPLPELNMDLNDLARKAQEMGNHGPKAAPINGAASRAHYLLAGSGVSPGKAYKDFQSLDLDSRGEDTRPPLPSHDADSERYLRELPQKGREAMMKESMERVFREVDAFIEESLGIDFDEQKQRIMEHFGLVPRDVDDADGSFGASPGTRGGFGKTRKSKSTFVEPATGSTRSVFGRSALDRSMIGSPGMGSSTASFFGEDTSLPAAGTLMKGQTLRDLRDRERLLVEQVEELNRARLQDEAFPILRRFADAELSAQGDSPRQLIDAYQALVEITQENPLVLISSDPAAVRERRYASAYLHDRVGTPPHTKLKKQILDGSRTHLEKAFFRELESMVGQHARDAQLGGRPSLLNKVRAYIRVRVARKDLAPDNTELQQIGENDDYCWALIFFLLRSGLIKEAADYVQNDPAFLSVDKRFVSYLTAYSNSPNRMLGSNLQKMIANEYQQRSRVAPEHSVDPYRLACYKIVGRCDLSRRNLDVVGQGVEDWIWLQFNLAREFERGEELAGEAFGLDQICETVRDIGEKHFPKGQANAGAGYGTYFFMQILAGMFEQAVDYLHAYNAVGAVHFAIVLAYYGLLRVSDPAVAGNELLTMTTTQQPQINFVPLVAYYTASFRTALPLAALDYLSLMCLNSDLTPKSLGTAQTASCHECLRQLCLETREFALLLGDIKSDGTRIPGAIEHHARLINLSTHKEFLQSITVQAAAIADERGQVADAVLLYHLCEEYDNVVAILNKALAAAVTIDLGETALQLQPLQPRRQPAPSNSPEQVDPQSSLSLTQSTSSPLELAQNMLRLYNATEAYYSAISDSQRTTCWVLMKLLNARAHLEASPPRFMPCLETLNELNILPLQTHGSIPLIRATANTFAAQPQMVQKCVGVSIVWAVKAIGGEREQLSRRGAWVPEGAANGTDEVGNMKDILSSMAKDLMVFSGLVKYKLPPRVYDLLTRAGGEVGGY